MNKHETVESFLDAGYSKKEIMDRTGLSSRDLSKKLSYIKNKHKVKEKTKPKMSKKIINSVWSLGS